MLKEKFFINEVKGHYEIVREDGRFICSTDTIKEAMDEIIEIAKNGKVA